MPAAAAAAVPRNEPPGPRRRSCAYPGPAGYPGCAGRPGYPCWAGPPGIGDPVFHAGDMPCDGPCVPRPAAPRARSRAVAPARAVAHAAEEAAAVAARGSAELAFELLDAGIGALERLVLHQRGLHQRIDGVGRLAQAVPDRALGVRIALGILQRGKAVEQLGDELAFLLGSWPSPPPSDDGGVM